MAGGWDGENGGARDRGGTQRPRGDIPAQANMADASAVLNAYLDIDSPAPPTVNNNEIEDSNIWECYFPGPSEVSQTPVALASILDDPVILSALQKQLDTILDSVLLTILCATKNCFGLMTQAEHYLSRPQIAGP